MKKFTNKEVYLFLAEECKHIPELWDEFGEGILSCSEDADFWEQLSEQLDCFRICEECGKPMIEGFVINGCTTYCSEDCLHKHMSEEEYKAQYNDGLSDTYWTSWYEDSITYRNLRENI